MWCARMASVYYYEAIRSDGQRQSGHIEAESSSAVSDQLYKAGSFAVEIREASDRSITPGAAPISRYRGQPSRSQITTLIRELSMLVAAGLPLVEALSLAVNDMKSAIVARLVHDLRRSLEDGSSFHEALARHPQSFDVFTVNMVRVGEASGRLALALERIADWRESDQRTRSNLLSALLYPAFLVGTAVVALAIMLGFVVPRFKAMIVNAKVSVPPETQFILTLSDLFADHIAEVGAVVVIILALLVLAVRSAGIRRRINAALLHLPIIGRLMRLAITFRFCRAIATLLECGVELPRALMLSRDLFDNHRVGRAIDAAYQALRKGQDFTGPLERSGLFQPIAIGMLRVGQETGDLAGAAKRTADISEDKFQVALRRVFIVFEPAIILIVSLFVAGVIVSIIGAVISVNDLVL